MGGRCQGLFLFSPPAFSCSFHRLFERREGCARYGRPQSHDEKKTGGELIHMAPDGPSFAPQDLQDIMQSLRTTSADQVVVADQFGRAFDEVGLL